MKCDCHIHIFMDGQNYQKARGRHQSKVDDSCIREHLQEYQKRGITWLRDGGDFLGVSLRTCQLAPEYNITYRTPVFAIHKKGHYGSIVGKAFTDLKEYAALVKEVRRLGGNFIKIMTTGIMDFGHAGTITGERLPYCEVKEMVHIAHEEGFAVMSHTNGIYGARAAIEAGVDSLEHGNYMDGETISMLAESHTVWVPTLVTVRNLLGCGRYEDEALIPIMESAEENLKAAFLKGAKTALGSDAGAFRVMHGTGIRDEYEAFLHILGDSPEVKQWMKQGEEEIKRRFRRN